MKTLFTTCLLLIAFAINAFTQTYNISTGIDIFDNPVPVPPVVPEVHWTCPASPAFPVTQPLVIYPYAGFWQPTPIPGTGAGWINMSGDPYSGSVPGFYTFERDFYIPPGTCSFCYDMSVTSDDSIVSLEFIDPGMNSIPLSAPFIAPWYYLDPVLGTTINNPTAGTWRIRTVVHFIDAAAGFLCSGFINVCQGCFAAQSNSGYMPINTNLVLNGTYTSWPDKVYIAPNTNVTVLNGTLDITNSDVVLGECASITIANGGNLRANNSVFRPCCEGQTWDGIHFQGDGRGQLNQNTFKQALRAINFQGGGGVIGSFNVRITDNSFINCRRGISATGVTLEEAITGNTFTIDQRDINYEPKCVQAGTYNNQHFGIEGLGANFRGLVAQNHFVNTSEQGSLRNFLGVHWTGCSGVIAQNTFSNMYTAVELAGCRAVTVEDNDMDVTMSVRNAPLNQIRVSSGSNTIWITDNRMVNSQEYASNTGAAAIYLDRSSNVNVKENEVEGFETGIRAGDMRFANICENKIRNSNIFGILVQNSILLDVTCNEIFMRQHTGLANFGIAYIRSQYDQPSVQPQFRNNCVNNTTFAMLLWKFMPGFYPLPRITNNAFYNYTNVGIFNIAFVGSIGTALAPFTSTGHNTFTSNNIPGGALDIQSTFPITVYGNFGISSVSPGVAVLGNNLYNASTACAHQIGTVSTELPGADFCDLFTENIASTLLRIRQGNLDLLRSADLATGERFELGMAALLDARQHGSASAGAIHDLLLQEGMLTLAQAWRVHYTDLMAQGRYGDALAWINQAAGSGLTTEAQVDELAVQGILTRTLHEGRDPRSFTTLETQVLQAIADKEGEAADLAQDLLQGQDLNHNYRFRALPLPEYTPVAAAKVVVLADAQLTVFPNPATDKVAVRYTLPEPEGARLQVSNLLGQVLHTQALDANAQTLELQLGDLPSGIYQLSVLPRSGAVLTQRLVKR